MTTEDALRRDVVRRDITRRLGLHWAVHDTAGEARFNRAIDMIMEVVDRLAMERDAALAEVCELRDWWSDQRTAGNVTSHPYPHWATCRWCGQLIHRAHAKLDWSTRPDRADDGCALAPVGVWPGGHWPSASRSPNGPMTDPVPTCRCQGAVIHTVGDAEAGCRFIAPLDKPGQPGYT